MLRLPQTLILSIVVPEIPRQETLLQRNCAAAELKRLPITGQVAEPQI